MDVDNEIESVDDDTDGDEERNVGGLTDGNDVAYACEEANGDDGD